MTWQNFMLSAFDDSFYNWKITLQGIDAECFKNQYLDPIKGNTGMVRCPQEDTCIDKVCHGECNGVFVNDSSFELYLFCKGRFPIRKFPVERADLKRYSLSYLRFHSVLCDKLALILRNDKIDDFLWHLGDFKCGIGRFLPVYISYYHTAKILTEKLKDLFISTKEPFVLIVYDYAMISSQAIQQLQAHNCSYISMDDLFVLNYDCSLELKNDPKVIFDTYKTDKTFVPLNKYHCPPGTKWSDIHINYQDGDTVNIWRSGEASLATSYQMLGMSNHKTNSRKLAFEKLIEILRGEDKLTIEFAKKSKAYDRYVGRIREINNALKDFFPDINDGNPIFYDDTLHKYIVKFSYKAN